VLIIDTTYFGRKYGIMVFRSYELKKNLYWKVVNWETIIAYKDGIKYLQSQWWIIEAVVCDGKRWLFWLNVPVQMCVFHQKQIMRKYITKNPILEANKELNDITSMLWIVRKTTIKEWLADWHRRYKVFLSEKNESGNYVHIRTRKAYRSLNHNLPYLYTFEDYQWEIQIPKTTNSLESVFWHMKQKIWLHRWLKKERKLKLIDDFLSK